MVRSIFYLSRSELCTKQNEHGMKSIVPVLIFLLFATGIVLAEETGMAKEEKSESEMADPFYDLTVQPNPVKAGDRIWVHFTARSTQYYTATLKDVTGNEVAHAMPEPVPVFDGKSHMSISTNGLPTGPYFVCIRVGSASTCRELMIE